MEETTQAWKGGYAGADSTSATHAFTALYG